MAWASLPAQPTAPSVLGSHRLLSLPENGGKGPALIPLLRFTNEETESQSSPGAHLRSRSWPRWSRGVRLAEPPQPVPGTTATVHVGA